MYNIVPHVFNGNLRLGSVFDTLFDDFFEAPIKSSQNWIPPVDFHEDESKYQLSMEMPGIKKDQIDITLIKNVLKISGEKKQEISEDSKRIERRYGIFSRSFSVPDSIDQDNIIAKFDNGVLTVIVPKMPNKQSKKIMIESI